jgi:hypothetical protein
MYCEVGDEDNSTKEANLRDRQNRLNLFVLGELRSEFRIITS